MSNLIATIQYSPQTTARTCLKLLGHMTPALSYLRCFQTWIWTVYTPNRHSLSKHLIAPLKVLDSLPWQKEPLKVCRGIPFSHPPSSKTLTMDSWRAHLQGVTAQGKWSMQEITLHINFLELRAVCWVYQHFLHNIQGHSVRVILDNRVAMCYVNQQGLVRSQSLFTELLKLKLVHFPSDRNLSGLSTRPYNCRLSDLFHQDHE